LFKALSSLSPDNQLIVTMKMGFLERTYNGRKGNEKKSKKENC